MRVVMVVGFLMFNVIAGFYEGGWALDASTDAGLSDGGQVRAYDGEYPPPPSYP
jgi:hypothetical protein